LKRLFETHPSTFCGWIREIDNFYQLNRDSKIIAPVLPFSSWSLSSVISQAIPKITAIKDTACDLLDKIRISKTPEEHHQAWEELLRAHKHYVDFDFYRIVQREGRGEVKPRVFQTLDRTMQTWMTKMAYYSVLFEKKWPHIIPMGLPHILHSVRQAWLQQDKRTFIPRRFR
jgi:hypothetical protein